VCQGDVDEVVDSQLVYAWLDSLAADPTLLTFANTGHYFHGKLVELRQRLKSVIVI